MKAARERRGREREGELARGGEGDRAIEEMRDDDAEASLGGARREVEGAEEAEDRRLEDEGRASLRVEEAIDEIVMQERFVSGPWDGAAAEERQIPRGNGLLDEGRAEEREVVDTPLRFVERPGAVGVEADLDRWRELAAEDREGGEVAREGGGVARAELDFEGGQAASDELAGAEEEIGGVGRRDEEAVDGDGRRRVIAAEEISDGGAATLTDEIEDRGLEGEAGGGDRANIKGLERSFGSGGDSGGRRAIEIDQAEPCAGVLEGALARGRVVRREAEVRRGLALPCPALVVDELEEEAVAPGR
jgi:hypothetical protein